MDDYRYTNLTYTTSQELGGGESEEGQFRGINFMVFQLTTMILSLVPRLSFFFSSCLHSQNFVEYNRSNTDI